MGKHRNFGPGRPLTIYMAWLLFSIADFCKSIFNSSTFVSYLKEDSTYCDQGVPLIHTSIMEMKSSSLFKKGCINV